MEQKDIDRIIEMACIAAMPDANKMAEHFADDEVAFVFLCLGNAKE